MADRDPELTRRSNRPGYNDDFACWIEHQAAALRDGRFDELDIAELVDEVEGLGRSEFDKLSSALEIVLLHMLKWDYQPERRGESWRRSIREHRRRLAKQLKTNPSHKARLDEVLEDAYPLARVVTERETGVFLRLLPERCPYSWDEIMTRRHELDGDWTYPDDII